MSKSKGLNDIAWEQLFEKYDILNRIDMSGSFQISATQIKEFREPRLMAKFDHILNLPIIFSKNKLSILPITRGDYVISHFEAYHKFEETDNNIIKVAFPSYIQSLDYNNITSETVALNCAIATGILEDFTGDEQIVPTVSGRMGSGNFDFMIKNIQNGEYCDVSVNNSQIEIDAAYEGLRYLSLFEAKRDLSDDFLVRQIYYPYRTWQDRIEKEVKPIFLIYSNGIFRLFQYKFENPYDYGSLVLVKQCNYSIEDTTITAEDIQNIIGNSIIISEPNIPFPQANSFERVINLCELLSQRGMTKNNITENYDFDSRQSDYYTNAAMYLGLVNKDDEDKIYTLTKLGVITLKKSYKQRQLEFCKLILKHKVFNTVLKRYFETGVMPSNCDISIIMKNSELYKIEKDSTFDRRASTVKKWIEWIVGLINE